MGQVIVVNFKSKRVVKEDKALTIGELSALELRVAEIGMLLDMAYDAVLENELKSIIDTLEDSYVLTKIG